jgi:hypothetical protein
LILCADKKQETMELLELEKSGIRVASLLDRITAAQAASAQAA